MKLIIATDAWHPQVNGVVTTLATTAELIAAAGNEVELITPLQFRCVPCPTYREIPLALFPGTQIRRLLETFKPDHVHIATEGPLGLSTRQACRRLGLRFTTSYHTQFPEYINLRSGIPVSWGYAAQRWFHGAAVQTMVNTRQVADNLRRRGFERLVTWSRGVDVVTFQPQPRDFLDCPRPIMVYVGRVAVEKNVRAFLDLKLPGTKYIIGGGPALEQMRVQYRDAVFVGYLKHDELPPYLSAADVFVFPSRTDTFGIVMLEAMACGVPVAAFPVQGPLDVVKQDVTGCLDDNLEQAIRKALQLDRNNCRAYASEFSWDKCTQQFIDNLVPVC